MTIELDIDYINVYNDNDRSFTKAGRAVGLSVATFRNKYLKEVRDREYIGDYEEVSNKQQQKIQRLADMQRLERKSWRNDTRVVNALVEVDKELIEVVKKLKAPIIKKHKKVNKDNQGVLQLSDLHLAEVVDLPGNQFNLEIASKRLRKHVLDSLEFFKSQDIDSVLIAITGDVINAQSKPDKLLTNAVNFAKSISIAFDLLRQVITEISEDYPVQIVSCYSNEDRFDKDIGYVDVIAGNTAGSTIYSLLKIYFRDSNITFLEEGMEPIVNIKGTNILFAHGHTFTGKDMEVSSSKVRSKYAAQGKLVDLTITGHIHSASLSTGYARSGGLPGGNAYSEYALSACSRASQNLYVFGKNKRMLIVNDLQDTGGIVGYSFES